MPKTTESDSYLTSGEVARLLKVSQSAVMDWADHGRLPHFRTPGGHRRFRPAEVEAFRAEMESAA